MSVKAVPTKDKWKEGKESFSIIVTQYRIFAKINKVSKFKTKSWRSLLLLFLKFWNYILQFIIINVRSFTFLNSSEFSTFFKACNSYSRLAISSFLILNRFYSTIFVETKKKNFFLCSDKNRRYFFVLFLNQYIRKIVYL